ncbi:MAG TPA: hypothetical protein ENK21_06700 [Trueperaceae bacterium]|nr:hypothetical protein [Trueperaceae bacterium]
MKKKLFTILLITIIFTQALAQLGGSKESLLEQLSTKYIKTVLGYTNSKGFDFGFKERGSSLMAVSGETILDEDNINQLTEMIVKATGYASIEDNVKEFFTTQGAELTGTGQQSIDLGEYILILNVTGAKAPYNIDYSLEVFEMPEENWTETDRAIGPKDAKYIIREFSDFECPFCAKFAAEGFPQIKEQLLSRDDVRFEYHHFPLITIHKNAFAAAEAAECVAADKADNFWIFHDALFENGQAWSKLKDPNPYFARLAKDLGFNGDSVEKCLTDRTFALSIDDAYNQAGGVLGIRGTPTIFINGFKILDVNNIESYLKVMKMIDGFDGE